MNSLPHVFTHLHRPSPLTSHLLSPLTTHFHPSSLTALTHPHPPAGHVAALKYVQHEDGAQAAAAGTGTGKGKGAGQYSVFNLGTGVGYR
jgi:hypothetical protein